MDRIQFIQSIDQKDKEFVSMVIGFFDQYMALYSLVGQYEHINIINDVKENITFTISFESEAQAQQLQSIIASTGYMVTIYERTFTIVMAPLDSNTLSITLR